MSPKTTPSAATTRAGGARSPLATGRADGFPVADPRVRRFTTLPLSADSGTPT